jgi:hypothetical protein
MEDTSIGNQKNRQTNGQMKNDEVLSSFLFGHCLSFGHFSFGHCLSFGHFSFAHYFSFRHFSFGH